MDIDQADKKFNEIMTELVEHVGKMHESCERIHTLAYLSHRPAAAVAYQNGQTEMQKRCVKAARRWLAEMNMSHEVSLIEAIEKLALED